jgi:hypothetical protein
VESSTERRLAKAFEKMRVANMEMGEEEDESDDDLEIVSTYRLLAGADNQVTQDTSRTVSPTRSLGPPIIA